MTDTTQVTSQPASTITADPAPVGERELGAFAKLNAGNAGDFIERLDRMQQYDGFRLYKEASFAAMRLAPGMVVADIGCGAGDDVLKLSHLVGPEGMAIGVDISADMVEEARKRFAGAPALDFTVAQADSLPFADGSLDAIRADRVLIHVPDPAAAIAEMLRVLRPGGRLVLCDPDMVGFWVSSADPMTSQIVSGAIAKSCVNPFLARDMGVMLRDLALPEVAHHAMTMVTDDFAVVDRVVRFELVAQKIAAAGLLPAGQIEGWLAEQLQRRDEGRFAAGLSVMMACATKG
ncbi:MAG TPA: methyltransferase domain-containing protein [Novosphingobium sp.]|nr:methyltransferase domain-containing protein [Novosphingobium sp.]HZV11075.1 methyltransferase domain-containing protein [Novosphingobium sp.]